MYKRRYEFAHAEENPHIIENYLFSVPKNDILFSVSYFRTRNYFVRRTDRPLRDDDKRTRHDRANQARTLPWPGDTRSVGRRRRARNIV